ncbi:O-antigen ligase family protein [Clostridioides sp. GD02377]|uniref:O-antigen ligase family protein n=1 Tax=unclassified Clostridioides TaxID=2635829 RepID=UPI0038A97FBE
MSGKLNKYYNRGKVERINEIILCVILLMLCIIPIVNHVYKSTNYSPIFTLVTQYASGQKMEIFNFYKTFLLYLGTFIVFILFLYKILFLKEDLKNKKLNIMLLILTIGIIISPLVSKYKDIALFGNTERYEGAIAWFCYVIIFFILYNTKIKEKYFSLFYFGLFPFLFINLFLGLANFFGYNVLSSNILNIVLGGKALSGTYWTTLTHFNYMSGIASVIFSISLTYLLIEKNNKKKIGALIGNIVSFILILVSNSISGFLTSIVVLPIILLAVYSLTDKKDKKTFFVWFLSVFVLDAIIYFLLNGYNNNVYKETFSVFADINNISPIILPVIVICFIIFIFIIKYSNKKKLFNIITIVIVGSITVGSLFFSMSLNKQNSILETNPDANITKIEDSAVFKSVNSMSTDRLNIWTKAIGYINDKPILGHGFDTFPYEIISKDKDGATSSYGEIIDKPHNWYISVTYGSGLVGLVGLVGIIICLLKGAFYKFADKINDKYLYIFIFGLLAYAIQAVFNDSLVGNSVIFWVIGGISANRIFNTDIEEV